MTPKPTKRALLGLAMLAASTTGALAQGAAPPAPPKVMAQLDALKGTWLCHGDVPAGPYGPARKTTTDLQLASDLDGRWLSGRIADRPSKGTPQPFRGVVHMTYDTAAKAFLMLWIDNTGGRATQTAAGWEADKMVWSGEGLMEGQKIVSRDTFTRRGADLHHLGEMQMDGRWVVVQDEVCKRTTRGK